MVRAESAEAVAVVAGMLGWALQDWGILFICCELAGLLNAFSLQQSSHFSVKYAELETTWVGALRAVGALDGASVRLCGNSLELGRDWQDVTGLPIEHWEVCRAGGGAK